MTDLEHAAAEYAAAKERAEKARRAARNLKLEHTLNLVDFTEDDELFEFFATFIALYAERCDKEAARRREQDENPPPAVMLVLVGDNGGDPATDAKLAVSFYHAREMDMRLSLMGFQQMVERFAGIVHREAMQRPVYFAGDVPEGASEFVGRTKDPEDDDLTEDDSPPAN